MEKWVMWLLCWRIMWILLLLPYNFVSLRNMECFTCRQYFSAEAIQVNELSNFENWQFCKQPERHNRWYIKGVLSGSKKSGVYHKVASRELTVDIYGYAMMWSNWTSVSCLFVIVVQCLLWVLSFEWNIKLVSSTLCITIY